ncbi:DeoR/GlpR family DNA-binding transcription regulator [Phaeobacter inhibens]|uniref:DeoR/GlpR family DNA-binding transcription regulator n=1 Tax=Phaeobacter inhibens TaxID=221822 RepID=UPI0021A43164|nr:DeoR/GlpR family DNA-binding transcription regulator [Phaeobacter inhibens]UWR71276.1 DeoR/GlpR family DNA-binding transcription regulator [Phaeobacter inhibens]
MSKYEQDILSTVNLHGRVSVLDLARILQVSDQTVRRIVKPMVEDGRLSKVHGALVSTQNVLDPPFIARMSQNRAAKVAIANAVAQWIPDGSAIAIDTGSTSGFVAQALRRRKNLTVVTNSAFIAATLSMEEGNRVFMAGTQLRNHDGAAFDRAAYDVIAGVSVQTAVLSASLVHPVRGFMVYDQCEADMALAMTDIAERTFMAVDSTKFSDADNTPALRLPELAAHDLIVTDRRPPPAYRALPGKAEFLIADGPTTARSGSRS